MEQFYTSKIVKWWNNCKKNLHYTKRTFQFGLSNPLECYNLQFGQLWKLKGFGATLQHYNPLIDEEVRKEWGVPENWKLIAQMPFGKPVVPAGEKEYQPLENRVKIYK